MKRFEIQIIGCPACKGNNWEVIDTWGEFKPDRFQSEVNATRLAGILNETWEKIQERATSKSAV